METTEIVVDVTAERGCVGARRLRGQWVDLYAVLALARTEPAGGHPFVTDVALARVGLWRHKAVASVGREVARHLKGLERDGLSHVITSDRRTAAWRLGITQDCLVLLPDRPAVEKWIESRSAGTIAECIVSGEEWLCDLRALVEATGALQDGEAGMALTSLDGMSGTSSRPEPALEAWAALLRGRAVCQHDDRDDEVLHRLCQDWSGRTDAVARAVGARLRACIAIRYRFDDPAGTLADLRPLAAGLEVRGDIGSLAVVENAMGLLARRAGDPNRGAAHHLRAAAFAGVSGDYPLLQAALFNLAICRRALLERSGRPPDRAVLALVELCRSICARFGVGKDSAQAEISGAIWAFELGDMTLAHAYLREAEPLVERTESTFDQAYFLKARATIELAAPCGASRPRRDLRRAEALFEKVGDTASAAAVRAVLKSLKSPP